MTSMGSLSLVAVSAFRSTITCLGSSPPLSHPASEFSPDHLAVSSIDPVTVFAVRHFPPHPV